MGILDQLRNYMPDFSLNPRSDIREKIIQQQVQIANETLSKLITLPVIGITGGRSNPVVGVVIAVTNVGTNGIPVPLISDYIDMSSLVFFGKLFIYSPERLEAICKLTPKERDLLFTNELSLFVPEVDICLEIDNSKVLSYTELNEILKTHHFFDTDSVKKVTDVMKNVR